MDKIIKIYINENELSCLLVFVGLIILCGNNVFGLFS